MYVFQIADPGRYLQCVRTLRDYAGKGCWEAQVRDWGQFTNFQLVSCDGFSLSICSFVLSLYSPAVIQKSSKMLFFWQPFICHFLVSFLVFYYPGLHFSRVGVAYWNAINWSQEGLTDVDVLFFFFFSFTPLNHKSMTQLNPKVCNYIRKLIHY